MSLGSALFLIMIIWFAIVFRGFREYLIACPVIVGIGFIVLAMPIFL